ncbi:phosphatidylcholine:ceramide cholinephosphotransferase 1-like [Tachypleus tridentatus]|uniref:phosphatidylcholine:ceramide cholinephosphotransferase 1-like n=1 Tax=Tachypleus tridentatus TaxID=6853 RepID=UPI003FD62C4B
MSVDENQPLLTNGKYKVCKDTPNLKSATESQTSFEQGMNYRESSCLVLPCENHDAVKINLSPEREEPRLPSELCKTVIAFFFMFFNLVLNLTCLAIVHDKVPDRTKYPPLPDIFFDVFSSADWALNVSEIIIITSVLSSLLIIFFHRHRFIVLRRVFLIMGLLYFFRSITMFVTQVPVASMTYYCSPKENNTTPILIVKRVLHLLSGLGLSINGQHTFCGDYIYSGHTVILTMTFLVMNEYTPRRCWILHWVFWCASVTGIFMVLLSRGHYTVDVVLAYFVTSRVFWIYHTLANNHFLKTAGPTNYFAQLWWFHIFSYFERNVTGIVPCQYEWPLPLFRRCLRRILRM